MPLQESAEAKLNRAKVSSVEKKMLLRKIAQMNNLPTPSANMMKVMLLLRDEDVKIEALVAAIEKDQSMVAQILKLVNSGFYGLRKTVETVEHAIALLGIINTKQVVYSASIMEFFSDDEQLEWNHSYSSSVLMNNLIKENELPGINILPMAMLMHDLGKVVLRRFAPKKYQVALQNSIAEKLPLFKFEDAMLQINHAEVGGVLLEKWDTAEEIVKPVAQHHCEGVPEEFVFETALVQFVNWIDCSARGIPCFEPSREIMNAAGIEEIDKDYWLNSQRALIDNLEKGGSLKGRQASPTGATNLNDTDTKSLDKRGGPNSSYMLSGTVVKDGSAEAKAAAQAPDDAPPEAQEEPGSALPGDEAILPQELEDGSDTAEMTSLPQDVLNSREVEDTAVIKAYSKAPEQQQQPANPWQPRIRTSVNRSAMTDKEKAFMGSAYKGVAEAAEPEELPQPPQGAEEIDKTPVSSERPTQVLRRKAPTVNVHPLPPPAKHEVELLQEKERQAQEAQPSAAQAPQRPTQVISRKTGQAVQRPPAHAPVQQEPQQPSAPHTPVQKPQKESPDIVLTTHASIPAVKFEEPPPRESVWKRFVAWLKDQL